MKVKVYNKKEYEELETTGDKSRLFLYDWNNYQYCKIEFLEEGIVGTTVIPEKTDLIHKEIYFGYYMVDNCIIFIDDSGIVDEIINKISQECTSEEFLFLFMDHLINQEVEFLQIYKERMGSVEESLMNYHGENLSGQIILYRKELQKLQSYYQQLMNVGEQLENKYSIFRKFNRRMERILLEIKELREYSVQIRELYQAQISVRQNKIMQMLTVVTTIFMPLNLLTGWYGMNFAGMKEVNWKYGYLGMILISIFIVVLEVLYFRRKKWFL